VTIPHFSRFADYARYYAETTPDAEAVALGDMRMSYRALDQAVDALASALIAAGVDHGDRVATLQTPCPDYFVAYLATTSIGAIWAGLNPRYRTNELVYVVEDCTPHVLLARTRIGDRDYAEEVAALSACGIRHVVSYEPAEAGDIETMADFLRAGQAVSQQILDARRAQCGGREACLLVYTSGTTGKPKGALLQQQGIIDFAIAQNRIWPVRPMRILNYFPINHIGCTVDLATPCLVAGGTIIFMDQFDTEASLDLLVRERITFWGSVPSIYAMQMAALAKHPRQFPDVQLIVWEGAAIQADLLEALAAICPQLATNYSMTESTSAIACVAPTADRDVLLNTVGRAFKDVEVRLVDLDDNEVSSGEPGEVQCRSHYGFLGYWNRPDASTEAFTVDGFFRTGDLAVRRPDGRYRIVGRLKEMYKSGGYNVYPREVEAVFEDNPAVKEAVIVAIPDPLWQEVGVAFVTLSSAATPDALTDWAKARLANYKLPKRVHIETELPLLPIGKVDRAALKLRARQNG
jgi:acyl-CoA synthetase (AMP-forming)/AMP-acid ligase II